MMINRKFDMFYNRRGYKKSPSVLKGKQMSNNLVVGKIETISDRRDTLIQDVLKRSDSFLSWLKKFKQTIKEQLQHEKDSETKIILSAQLITCDIIEHQYNRLQ